MLTGPVALLLDPSRSAPVPGLRLEPYPSDAWLGGYHYRGARCRPVAADVLALGAAPVFASIEEDGNVVAVGRGIVDEGWLGVTAVTVGEDHRRRGLGSSIMTELAGWGSRARGALRLPPGRRREHGCAADVRPARDAPASRLPVPPARRLTARWEAALQVAIR